MKKRTLALLVCMVLALTVSLGSTLAYLTSEDGDVNVMTLGKVEIKQHEYERVTDENGDPVKGVEGEDFTSDYGINESYKLQEFTSYKPAMPAVYQNGTTAWDDFQQLWNQVGAPGSNDLFDDSMKNVIDKFVFVENTGKSDAYYRTIIAIECPEGIADGLIHTSFNANSRFDYSAAEGVQNSAAADKVFVTLNGERYLVYTATYQEILTPGEVSRPSLLQLFLDPTADNEDVALFGENWEVLTLSQAIQAAGFTDAASALNAGFYDPATEEGKEKLTADLQKLLDNEYPTDEVKMPETDWADNADTDWYDAAKTEYTLSTAAELAGFAKLVNEGNSFSGKTVKLGADIDLKANLWEPIGQTGSTTFLGDFDGAGKTISNLFIDSEDQTGAHYASGLFGWLEYHSSTDAINIANVVVENAVVKGHHNVGVIAGYATGGSTSKVNVTNCSVWGAEVLCTYANGDADGDKAGVIIGNATAEGTFVTGCKAEQSTVSAGRDAGQIVGAGAVANVTDCTVKNVEVTDNGTGSGKNIRNEAVGRPL